MQHNIFDSTKNEEDELPLKKGGPVNRMNDLSYREWMKFQKSFFTISDNNTVFVQSITFFTKEKWPDDSVSRSLVIGLRNFDHKALNDKRIIEIYSDVLSVEDILEILHQKSLIKEMYDFILIDLRAIVETIGDLNSFLDKASNELFLNMKALLRPERYAQLVINQPEINGVGFPIAWSIAQSGRTSLRLRDEKIGLDKSTGGINYSIFFQNAEEHHFKKVITPSNIGHVRGDFHVPNFVFPKPPPRKKNEILHPAKFPETLISDFIEVFTKRGDVVFDPMVGTGSTIIAANRIGRSGYGVDLNDDFVKIAKNRIDGEHIPVLFDEYSSKVKGDAFQGDATKIDEISELNDIVFDYVITSPPYWSMLNNPGSENQKNRRQKGLSLVYSKSVNDLGNIEDYDSFLDLLQNVYDSLSNRMATNGKLTVIVKNVKRNHILYPLAWDIVKMLCGEGGKYDYIGTTMWCQDDVPLKPFAVGTHWVSNILHQYCLHFQKRS